jgi:hypothetical protein
MAFDGIATTVSPPVEGRQVDDSGHRAAENMKVSSIRLTTSSLMKYYRKYQIAVDQSL